MKPLICVLFLILFKYVFCDCGYRRTPFIGKSDLRLAKRNEIPWSVSLGKIKKDGFSHLCGAAVIDKRWIITDAQCIENLRISDLRALIGEIDIENFKNTSFITKIQRSVIHPKYISAKFPNAIALLFTETPIPINGQNIDSICLPKKNEKVSGTVFVSGWGYIDLGIPNNKLKVLRIKIFNDSICESLYNHNSSVFYKDLMFCGRGDGKYGDTCFGDIGGPAEVIKDETAYLVGIISFGGGRCYQEEYPGVYTEVSHYIDWIKEVTGVRSTINALNRSRNKKIKVNMEKHDKICGIRENPNRGKIIGGRFATKNEFPWTVALEESNKRGEYVHFCGASVITDRWVVTAAHCLYRKNLKKLRGVFGAVHLDKKTNVFITSFVETRIHNLYDHESRSFENDIALLKTNDTIPMSKSIKRICLPKSNEQFWGRVYVSGWGQIENGTTSDQLKVLSVNLYDDSDCSTLYEQRFNPELMICAGYLRGTHDACDGDSGGPLEKVENGIVVLIGIVSFGDECARRFYPGVYTEVSKYVTWIEQVIEGNSNHSSVN